MRRWTILGTASIAAACSGQPVDVGGYTNPEGGGQSQPPDSGSLQGATATICLRATTAPVAHNDGLAGQTPSDQKLGIRKLTLLTSANDPSPYVVFDHGASAVEAGLNEGNNTAIARLPISSLRAGNYVKARVGISHVRYRVAALMHAAGQSITGTFDNIHVLSDGSTINGQTYNKGHYDFRFEALGSTLGSQSGESGMWPSVLNTSGIELDTSGSEASYVFVVNLPIDPKISTHINVVFELNTHSNFRWQDQTGANYPGYATNVFDVTPTSYEPVKTFGANSYRMYVELTAAPGTCQIAPSTVSDAGND